ncbi:hypothetical protein LV564_07700 [Komagataeibacter nataicola]|nr:hypothetical protein [Komagataeibacter nataicola]WEQ56934.1 hypothetical protein LV564_07700 [Komagataeibacter nataicola]
MPSSGIASDAVNAAWSRDLPQAVATPPFRLHGRGSWRPCHHDRRAMHFENILSPCRPQAWGMR